MTQSALFRREVMEARRGEWFGGVVLVQPLSFALVTAFAVLCAGAILAFLFFGDMGTVISQILRCG